MGLSPLKRSAESSRVSFCLEPDIYLINFAFTPIYLSLVIHFYIIDYTEISPS